MAPTIHYHGGPRHAQREAAPEPPPERIPVELPDGRTGYYLWQGGHSVRSALPTDPVPDVPDHLTYAWQPPTDAAS